MCYQVPGHIISGSDCYVLLDGDQKKVNEFTKPSTIPDSQSHQFGDIILNEVGVNPKFSLSGGNNPKGTQQEKIEKQKEYLEWVGKRLRYLPCQYPEEFFLEEIFSIAPSSFHDSDAAKLELTKHLPSSLGAGEEAVALKVYLDDIPESNATFVEIRRQIREWLG